mmetsp:Transcript_34632/g.68095  ORF Transcript_34632/g.68095 Transcript_34632/m.68095 type:complete len:255 (+) Transcript_34632:27-791(+)|eukprot:CAMPEP_0175162554 /NCGR_PEP_ID=MMETSP0087-20121206/25219_1 /TAXON_ID=136419 /ORGANISM="Unknown Unknown, Strain D1" /LENGTH=254 /DNA_ID=CAMNT_0016451081 /DNA_START=31 /DNA_END=798 /DNA_ORIENTATION=+
MNLDDIPDLNAELEEEDDDLPSWGPSSTTKKLAAKPKPAASTKAFSAGAGTKSTSYREQLKSGVAPKPAREQAAEVQEPTSAQPVKKYQSKVTGKSDVLDRLTDTASYTGAYKSRFDSSGKGVGSKAKEERVQDLSQITRSDQPITAKVSNKAYQEYKEDQDQADQELATKAKKMLHVDQREFEVVELNDIDDMEKLKAEIQAELDEDDFGLPDFNASKTSYSKKKVVAKGKWSASTSTSSKAGAKNLRQKFKS